MNKNKRQITNKDLEGKMITISLIQYYQLLNDNSMLIAIMNAQSAEHYRQCNREEAYQRWLEQNGGGDE